jgi:hypothetical protein
VLERGVEEDDLPAGKPVLLSWEFVLGEEEEEDDDGNVLFIW